jgi:hypothetical protein
MSSMRKAIEGLEELPVQVILFASVFSKWEKWR